MADSAKHKTLASMSRKAQSKRTLFHESVRPEMTSIARGNNNRISNSISVLRGLLFSYVIFSSAVRFLGST
jgi:hypothetical protein